MRRPGAIWRKLVKNLGRKPVTVTYPKEPMLLPKNFRGRPVYDPKGCIGCKICERDCPSRAIAITKVAEKTWACTFALDRCVYCGQCADSCPKKTILMSHIYEMATFDRQTLIETTAGVPPPPVIPAPALDSLPLDPQQSLNIAAGSEGKAGEERTEGPGTAAPQCGIQEPAAFGDPGGL